MQSPPPVPRIVPFQHQTNTPACRDKEATVQEGPTPASRQAEALVLRFTLFVEALQAGLFHDIQVGILFMPRNLNGDN